MNNSMILFHLKEAREELEEMIEEVATQSDYDIAEFRVAIGHLYHHLNTAWNGRDSTSQEHEDCIQENFRRWRHFPEGSELFLDA